MFHFAEYLFHLLSLSSTSAAACRSSRLPRRSAPTISGVSDWQRLVDKDQTCMATIRIDRGVALPPVTTAAFGRVLPMAGTRPVLGDAVKAESQRFHFI